MSDKNIESIFPLSPVQEGILYHTLEGTRTGAYFEQYSCSLSVELEARRLRAAWQATVAAQPALRTFFAWRGQEKPLQIVRHRVDLPWREEDWSARDESSFERDWDALLAADRAAGFDLERAPLSRVCLIRGAGGYRLLWSFHHGVLDGWSLRLVLDEVADRYAAVASGPGGAVAAPSFAQFIASLPGRGADGENHWRQVLGGFQHPSGLIDRDVLENRITTSEPDTGLRTLRLNRDSGDALERYARAEKLTVNTLILGAWSVVLSRYNGCEDVVFGTTVSGRPVDMPGIENTVGMFINTLPLRVAVGADTDKLDCLRAIQAQQLAMRDHQHASLVEVRRCSDVPPGAPLFETIVVFQNIQAPRASTGRTELGVSNEHYTEHSHYPFALLVFPGETFELVAIYDPERFSASLVDRVLAQFVTALQDLADPACDRITQVSTLPPAQRELIRQFEQGPRKDLSQRRTVLDLIAEQCATRQNDIAVSDENGPITYFELENRTVALSARLRELGVERGDCVPVFAERGVDAIVAMLAVMHAGAAYVPIDAAHPAGRLSTVFANLRLDRTRRGRPARLVLITQPALMQRLPPGEIDPVIEGSVAADNAPGAMSAHRANARDNAYVIYTSGSTGQPKGVMVSHANLLNSTAARLDYYPQAPSSFLMISSIATDSSVAGIYWTLASGGKLVLPGVRIEQEPSKFGALLRGESVSHLLCLPSLYATLLDHLDQASFASLRCVVVAGEACARELVAAHHEACAGAGLYNEYGPTEATVWASVARLEASDSSAVTIGRPIANTVLYVLDEARRPLPVGVPGELYIGGANIAQGYLEDADKTAQAFVSDPFHAKSPSRIYRTGDRVYWRADGCLAFLGRVDDQVKIRGFRIEPQEIEAVLLEHAAVTGAAVTVTGGAQEQRTVPALDAESLARSLSELTPSEAEALIAGVASLTSLEVEQALHTQALPEAGGAIRRGNGASR